MKPFIPKKDPTIPDFYQVTIYFVTSKKEVFEVASHQLSEDNRLLELWTKDDVCMWIPMENIEHFEFDKNFSKIIAKKIEIDKKDF